MVIKCYSLKGPSLSSFAKLLILPRAISLAFFLGRNSYTSGFIVCSWAGAVISHDNSNGCICCIPRSRYDFPALNLTAFTLPSLPGYTSVMIPSFHSALFCLSPFMTTTSPTLNSGSLLLCFKLCFSRNDIRYSFLHLFHAASLHLCIYFCLFHKSLFSISVGSSLEIKGVWPST